MSHNRIYLSPPHLGGEELSFVEDAFASNWIAPLGPHVEAFENEVAQYVGSKSALALSSGTAAIHLALKYLGVQEGDYVFCSSLTFAGSCNPIMYEKAIPVFIDSEPDSWNMSPVALQKAFEAFENRGIKPKTVIIVNLYGQSADMDKLLPICEHYGVPVVEDAAESLGAMHKGKASGTFGHIGIFSFNGNKIITTSGGGMAVSNDLDAIKKMKFWATQAREPARHYEHKEVGYNYRLSNILAAIGRGQLRVLDERIQQKKRVYETYKKAFAGNHEIELMPIASYGPPNYWLTVITIADERITPEDVVKALDEKDIESRPVWKPMHLQPVFRESEYYTHDEDVSACLFSRGVCLPSGGAMTEEEQQLVVDTIKELL
ncbi:MAG: aminotransferase class I/II-fold pyridoxal phosphate-dependent enzyme [Limnochordia bacterium]|nr:aminotransferase class I/II-fold pyridoxal phosphate-dependent enzyme [Limnochordia bacterium]